MSSNRKISFRDGTSQRHRSLTALQPEYFNIDERNINDWIFFLKKLSREIVFYNSSNQPDGTWEPFFSSLDSYLDPENKYSLSSEVPAHAALFISFLELIDVARQDLNKLNEELLSFYFKRILRFSYNNPVPDKVHVLFELGKSIPIPVRLEQGTLLKAGKDPDGRDLFYKTDRESVISSAKAVSFKSIFFNQKEFNQIYAAPIANSMDGKGQAFDEGNSFWKLFGEDQSGKKASSRTMQDAQVGFAIASPILLLKEGKREIALTITFFSYELRNSNIEHLQSATNLFSDPEALSRLKSLTGKKYVLRKDFEDAVSLALGIYASPERINAISGEANAPLRHIDPEKIKESFLVYGSGNEGWTQLSLDKVSKPESNQLVYKLICIDSQPAIEPIHPDFDMDALGTDQPAIKFRLNPKSPAYAYESMRNLQIANINIKVTGFSIKDIILHNDNGPLDPTQAFLPFGSIPSIGTSFYIGSYEIFTKKIDVLKMTLQWADLPEGDGGFHDHYLMYLGKVPFEDYGPADPIKLQNSAFQAKKHVLIEGDWKPVSNDLELFNTLNASKLDTDFFTSILLEGFPYDRNFDLKVFSSYSQSLNRGFLRFSLDKPGFGHQVFPQLFTNTAIAISQGSESEMPNTPYTPKINAISLYYESSLDLDFDAIKSPEEFFHIEPFGSVKRTVGESSFILPQYTFGQIYVGMKDLHPPQNVTMLFQLLEGSGDYEVSIDKDDIHWSYLSNTGWKELSGAGLQTDTTLGLQKSGIIEFTLGRDASSNESVLPGGLHWIKGEISNSPDGIPKVLDIHTQSVSATFVSDINTSVYHTLPLPPGKITRLVNDIPAIKKIRQPYPSFDGASLEEEKSFNRRVSERLRHKQRAINVWDYEHMVLENFPEIYKVKCFGPANTQQEFVPGNVILVVIPNLRNKGISDFFQPKVRSALRNEIKSYLDGFTSFFVNVSVENPRYEALEVEASIALKPGFDGGFYSDQLNRDLIKFLSPWAYIDGEDIVFGGKIHKSQIINFIENLPYVEYIIDFKLYQNRIGGGIGSMQVRPEGSQSQNPGFFSVFKEDGGQEVKDFAEASTPKSILVSSRQHRITILSPGEDRCRGNVQSGVGFMAIGVDFVIH